jgi:Protein of unknown function (DUF1761)
MEGIQINVVAIIIATMAHFVLGFVWYTPLFGKLWAKEMGYNTNKMEPKKGEMMKGMAFMLIGNLLMAWVLAHNIAAWSFVPGMSSIPVFGNIMMSAIFTWLGFFVSVNLGNTVWERKSWTLFFINSGYQLLSLILVSTIITLMPA